jgi:tRNA (Thr-GGU) A37 N-methylase
MECQKPQGQLLPGEKAIDQRTSADADLQFIGSIGTPWKNRADCPRQGSFDGPLWTILMDEIWQPALAGLEAELSQEVFYWLHQAA